MQQIRIHGRGGQGSVTLAHLVAEAAYEEGQWGQAFPSFGVERRGAPVESFVRISDETITNRSQVNEPTHVVVQDETLIKFVDVVGGLETDGMILVNTPHDPSALVLDGIDTVVTIDATAIALAELGRPIMNTALLGAFAAVTDVLTLESVATVIADRFSGETGRLNVDTATRAFDEVSAA